MFFFFFPAPLGSSGFNCSSTGTSNQSQFLKSHHDKQPQFITHQGRNLELNVHSCTNPTLYFRRPQRGGTITAGALCGLAYTFTFSVCARACVVPHQRTTSFHSKVATWETSVPTLPPRRPPSLHLHRSFFGPTNGEEAGGHDVRCVGRGGCSLSPCIFFSGLHPAAQTASFIYTR